jgi:Sigma-70, region 4
MRFGLLDDDRKTLEEVGKMMHVTRERVRQIEDRALRKLRHPNLQRLLLDYVDIPSARKKPLPDVPETEPDIPVTVVPVTITRRKEA